MHLSSGTNGGSFSPNCKRTVKNSKKDPANYLWHSFWFLIRKITRVVGLGKEFEHNGYMTEAVRAYVIGLCNRKI